MIDRRTLVLRNIRRNKRNFAFTVVGIVLGVASFLFFVSLGAGVRVNVLERVFVSDQLEVVPRSIDIGGFRTEGSLFQRGSGLDDLTVDELRALPGVAGVYPKQEVAFPAYAFGGETLVGRVFWTELVADGIPSELVPATPDRAPADTFVDWEAPRACGDCAPGSDCVEGACVPRRCDPLDEVWADSDRGRLEQARARLRRERGFADARLATRDLGPDADPATRYRLVVGGASQRAARDILAGLAAQGQALGGRPVDPGEDLCAEAPSYCQPQRRRCEMPVPTLLSYTLLELYNGSIHSALSGTAGAMRGLPRMSESLLIGFQFDAILGRGYLGESRQVAAGDADALEVQLRIVGFSELAIPVGATVPLAYVQRWNAEFNGTRAAEQYSSILVRTESTEDLHRVAHAAVAELGLALDARYEAAQRASLMITIVTAVMALLSLLIIGLAALNIMHTLLMVVAERRREIGIMRAVGAARRDVYALILGEAAVIGVVGAASAGLLAWLAMRAVDAAFAEMTPDFPFKPDSLFHAPPHLWLAGAAIGLACCLLGAWGPAARAAKVDPARTMGGY